MKTDNWKSWAVGTIWIGVGLSAFSAGAYTILIALLAVIATSEIASAK